MFVSQVQSNRNSVPGQDSNWNQLRTIELCEALGQVNYRTQEFIHMIDQCDTSSSINENDDSSDSDPSTMMGMRTIHIIVTLLAKYLIKK